jgi:dihydroflavonol-4-reductase
MRMGPVVGVIAGRVGDVWGRITGKEPDVNSAALAAASLPHWFSSARAQEELGYRHRPVREAAEAAWAWFREHGYVKG